ncbi:hypothetical protein FMEAI12_4330007 [Parafrankia sp. Ea1.12]|nr:hypothetical protein FMEAI12_4330007 [Parafrankia sp. Ea1.12]
MMAIPIRLACTGRGHPCGHPTGFPLTAAYHRGERGNPSFDGILMTMVRWLTVGDGGRRGAPGRPSPAWPARPA